MIYERQTYYIYLQTLFFTLSMTLILTSLFIVNLSTFPLPSYFINTFLQYGIIFVSFLHHQPLYLEKLLILR